MSIDYQELTGKLITENGDLKNELSYAEQELNSIYDLVERTPNNMELGKIIRSYYWAQTEDKGGEQLELFEDNGE